MLKVEPSWLYELVHGTSTHRTRRKIRQGCHAQIQLVVFVYLGLVSLSRSTPISVNDIDRESTSMAVLAFCFLGSHSKSHTSVGTS
jgi:hypothetical protein